MVIVFFALLLTARLLLVLLAGLLSLLAHSKACSARGSNIDLSHRTIFFQFGNISGQAGEVETDFKHYKSATNK